MDNYVVKYYENEKSTKPEQIFCKDKEEMIKITTRMLVEHDYLLVKVLRIPPMLEGFYDMYT